MKIDLKNYNYAINYIESKITPYKLNEYQKNTIKILFQKYSLEEIINSIDISFKKYISIDYNNNIMEDSINNFINKVGGIAYNNSKSPIEKKKIYIRNYCKNKYLYWNDEKAKIILDQYVNLLFVNGWSKEDIEYDLDNECFDVCKTSSNWTEWRNHMEGWINSLQEKDSEKKDISEGSILKNTKEYKIIKQIGAGSFGITYLAFEENLNKYFVVKEFSCEMIDQSKNNDFFEKFIYEIKILFNLNHKNIVRIFDYFIDKNNKKAYYLMELIEGQTIEAFIKDNKSQTTNIFKQLIAAFEYLEENNYCHRDVRINNILIDNNGTLKLIDFGFIKNYQNSKTIHSATQLIDFPYEWPLELRNKKQIYDNKTEIYFVGKLFEDVIKNANITKFKYKKILTKMCNDNPKNRYKRFSDIKKELTI